MANQTVAFTIKKRNNETPFNIDVEEFEFLNSIEVVTIKKIIFIGSEADKIEGNFQDNKTYQLVYDDSEVEDDRVPVMTSSAGHSAGKIPKKLPNVLFLQPDGELRIVFHNTDTMKITEKKEKETKTPDLDEKDPKKALIEKNIQQIRAKLSAAGITPEQEKEILGNVWENTYQHLHIKPVEEIEAFKKERLEDIDKWITKHPDPNKKGPETPIPKKSPGPGDKKESPEHPIPPPPTPSETSSIKNKLDEAVASDDKDEIINTLKTKLEEIINNPDESLQQSKKTAENKLSQVAQDELHEIIKQEIQFVLNQNGVESQDLPTPIQTKYTELNNNNNNNNDQDIRDEIVQAVGEQALNQIINALQQALSEKDKTKIESKVQELEQFNASQIGYRKHAIETCPTDINQLFEQARRELASTKNENDNSSFFRIDNPVMWVSGLAIIALVVGVIWMVVNSQQRREVEE